MQMIFHLVIKLPLTQSDSLCEMNLQRILEVISTRWAAGGRDDDLGLEICFVEYSYHDSLRARLKEGIGHYEMSNSQPKFEKKFYLSARKL